MTARRYTVALAALSLGCQGRSATEAPAVADIPSPPASANPTAATRVPTPLVDVRLFFPMDSDAGYDCRATWETTRAVRPEPDLPTAVVRALVEGPARPERETNLYSPFRYFDDAGRLTALPASGFAVRAAAGRAVVTIRRDAFERIRESDCRLIAARTALESSLGALHEIDEVVIATGP